MFIQTEQTPNPATLKFLPGRTVLPSGTASFPDATTAAHSPLAQRLFGVEGVEGVFLGADFVTVTKSSDKEWYILKPGILGAIMEAFASGEPISVDSASVTGADTAQAEDDPLVLRIKELIDQRVRPAVAQDGGDIVFHRFHEGIVYLEMHGSCAGCPSSTATLKAGIENMLRHYIPEVTAVEAI